MSMNGHVVTPIAVETEGSNRRRQNGITSEKIRLDGNIARRKVKTKEFFWWETELPGFGLRAFAAGSKSWFVQFRQRGKQKRRQGPERELDNDEVGSQDGDDRQRKQEVA